MGLYDLGKQLSHPGLSAGHTIASLKIDAISWLSRDFLQIMQRGLLRAFLHFFNKRTGKWSGPGAELVFRLSISSSIIFSVMLMSRRQGRSELSRLKKETGSVIVELDSGREYTEEYWVERHSLIS